uniref:Uncharacterized protein n=2 Tax=Helianthus annuus TaxID=4232 RepID=A0A251USA2_HELAN
MSPQIGVVRESRYFAGDRISFRVHIGARLHVHRNPYPCRSSHSELDEELRRNAAHTCFGIHLLVHLFSFG